MHLARITSARQRELAFRLVSRLEPKEPCLQAPFAPGSHEPAWAVYDDDGFMCAAAAARVDANGCLSLTSCVIAPRARGHNLQRRLIRTRVAYGKRLGVPQVVTYTNRSNRPSQVNLLKEQFFPFATQNGTWVWYARFL